MFDRVSEDTTVISLMDLFVLDVGNFVNSSKKGFGIVLLTHNLITVYIHIDCLLEE